MNKLKKNGNSYGSYIEMVKDVKSFSDAPSVSVNPFRDKLKQEISMQRRYVKSDYGIGSFNITDSNTGEVVSRVDQNKVFTKREYVDNQSFVKLYMSKIKDMFKLSHSAIKVFGFLLSEMQKGYNTNRDFIYFSLKDCMEYCQYDTHPMVYRGLTELISHGFIAKCEDPPNHFFIDATIAFNGNRIAVLEEYVRIDGPDDPKREILPNTSFDDAREITTEQDLPKNSWEDRFKGDDTDNSATFTE